MTAVRHAPSAGFTQGTEYLVLDDPDAVADFWSLTDDLDDPLTPQARAILPPVLVLPCAHRQAYLDRYAAPDKAGLGMDTVDGWPAPYWDLDAAMAAMLILLAAVDEDVGAWLFGIFRGLEAVVARFSVPDGYQPIGVIGLGYPADEDPYAAAGRRQRPRRATTDLLHHNGWTQH